MNRQGRQISFVLVGMLAALFATPAIGDTIRLKSSVRLPAGADVVRLSDIAELQGDEALQYADLIVAEIGHSTVPLELPIGAIRAKLDEEEVEALRALGYLE